MPPGYVAADSTLDLPSGFFATDKVNHYGLVPCIKENRYALDTKPGSREQKKAPERQRQRRSSGRPVFQRQKEKSVITAWRPNTA
jgi:hypothetical protein